MARIWADVTSMVTPCAMMRFKTANPAGKVTEKQAYRGETSLALRADTCLRLSAPDGRDQTGPEAGMQGDTQS
jgi:hypothetical protein